MEKSVNTKCHKLTRTVHPVGVGAFITEFFEIESSSELLVMYDCGEGTSSKTSTKLKQIIDNYFDSLTSYRTIDILFLSHFDNDHINGLEYLLTQGYANSRTFAVLPLISDDYYDIFEYCNDLNYIQVVNDLRKKRIPIVFVRTDEKRENIAREQRSGSCDIESNDLIADSYEDLTSLPIPVFSQILSIWRYRPFYLHDSAIFQSFIRSLGEDENPIDTDSLNNFINWSEPERKKLKIKYKLFNSKLKIKGVTAINMYAMLLISQKNHGVKEYKVCSIEGKNQNDHHIQREKEGHYPMLESAVFTSDVGLKDPTYFKKFEDALHQYCQDGVGLLQVPHHGSKNNYNSSLFKLDTRAAFCNGIEKKIKRSDPIIDSQIKKDANQSGIPFYIVNELPENILRQRIELTV